MYDVCFKCLPNGNIQIQVHTDEQMLIFTIDTDLIKQQGEENWFHGDNTMNVLLPGIASNEEHNRPQDVERRRRRYRF